jgi:hypothetical protein
VVVAPLGGGVLVAMVVFWYFDCGVLIVVYGGRIFIVRYVPFPLMLFIFSSSSPPPPLLLPLLLPLLPLLPQGRQRRSALEVLGGGSISLDDLLGRVLAHGSAEMQQVVGYLFTHSLTHILCARSASP